MSTTSDGEAMPMRPQHPQQQQPQQPQFRGQDPFRDFWEPFEKFFGQPPPRDDGDRALRALLSG